MLLGPSKRLELRHLIKDSLCDNDQYGYPHENIIIMEDEIGDENLVISKFGNILDKTSPQLFFVLLESDTEIDMSGVIFELGWLCGKYNRKEISNRLRIIADFDFPWRKTTRYVQSLIQTASSQLILINQIDVELISNSIHNNVTISIDEYNTF
jgi:hypothetical protein